MAFWWVNQGSRFREERALSCLWAPEQSKDGRKIWHWETLIEVKTGDTVFHYQTGFIRAISKVVEDAVKAPQPTSTANHLNWNSEQGYLIKLDIQSLENPISLKKISEDQRRLETSIFTHKGFPKQGYLFPASKQIASQILSLKQEIENMSSSSKEQFIAYIKDWRSKRSITIPVDLKSLRKKFNSDFPKEKISELSLEDYALGHREQNSNSFCQQIEFDTEKIGSVAGGSAFKHGVFWSASKQQYDYVKSLGDTPEEAFNKIKQSLVLLIKNVESGEFEDLDRIADQISKNNNVLRVKPLSLYFPDLFLPIIKPSDLDDFLQILDLPISAGTLTKNRTLLQGLKSLPELEGFDTWGMMCVLYNFKNSENEQIDVLKITDKNRIWIFEIPKIFDFQAAIQESPLTYPVPKEESIKQGDTVIFIDSFTEQSTRICAIAQIVLEPQPINLSESYKKKAIRDLKSFNKDNSLQFCRAKLESKSGFILDFDSSQDSIYERLLGLGLKNTAYEFKVFSIEEDLAIYLGIENEELYDPVNIEREVIYEKDDRNYWIFQCNPKKFDLISALKNLDSITWLINQNKNKVKPGDKVYFWVSGAQAGIVGFGIIASEPQEMEIPIDEKEFIREDEKFNGERLRVVVDIVEYLDDFLSSSALKNVSELKELSILKFTQGTNFFVRSTEAKFIDQLIEKQKFELRSRPIFTRDQLLTETGHKDGYIDKTLRALNRKQQIILTGAPGSGKTHLAHNLAKHLTSETDGIIETIQLHPAYTYEDFIQGLRPIANDDGQLTYQMIPGRFLDFCDRARTRTGKSVLIIDEINRANLASVFGELLYLLEYRDQNIKLAGSDRTFSIPENVYIIGTMNTADRSIALVDHALRRRFAFIELRPDYNILRKWHDRENTGFNPDSLIKILEKVNEAINDKHHEIGISFFLDRDLKNNIANIWELEIYPYLEEFFYGDLKKIESFCWKNIEAQIHHNQNSFDD